MACLIGTQGPSLIGRMGSPPPRNPGKPADEATNGITSSSANITQITRFGTLANWGMLYHKPSSSFTQVLGRPTIPPISSIGPGLPGGRFPKGGEVAATPPPSI